MPARYAAAVTWSPEHAVTCLKEEGLRSVWLVQRPDESQRIAKYWPVTVWGLLKHLVGASQSARQLRGARRLEGIGIRTPVVVDPPRVVVESGRRLVRVELAYVPGATVTEWLESESGGAEDRRSLASQLGDCTRRIAEAGYLHRDLRPSNIVVESGRTGPVAWLIDPVGMRRCTDRVVAIARMLNRLDTEVRRRRAITGGAWRLVLREAVGGLSASDRRAVFERLRAHRPR